VWVAASERHSDFASYGVQAVTTPRILYRDGPDWRLEAEAARRYFDCFFSRLKVQPGDLVIPRFSALPFFKELEDDVLEIGAKLINSRLDHEYLADLGQWYPDLEGITPRTWYELHHIPEEGPFILKGETNSKKYNWRTHMYAENKREAIEVHSRLCADSLISQQKIYVREYVPLRKLMDGLQGLPITNEFRFFFYGTTMLSGGFYWSSHTEDLQERGISLDPAQVPDKLLRLIAGVVAEHATYFVADVAETESGEWILIELNDGTQSGISENNPETLYRNLKAALCPCST
jgi:hypothetical protein